MSVLVTGMHRSGTSITAKIVMELGFNLGSEADFQTKSVQGPENHENPTGTGSRTARKNSSRIWAWTDSKIRARRSSCPFGARFSKMPLL
jgi:hypothetical protein